jgi:hypothetical protein
MRFTMKNKERVVKVSYIRIKFKKNSISIIILFHIKIPIIIPIFVLIISVYLVCSPVIDDPRIEYLGKNILNLIQKLINKFYFQRCNRNSFSWSFPIHSVCLFKMGDSTLQ